MDEKKVHLLYSGEKLEVYVTMKIMEQIESAKDSVKKKLFNRIKRLGDFGYINNTEQFRKIEGSGCENLWEIKLVSDGIRYFVYYDYDLRDKAVIFGEIKKTEKKVPKDAYKKFCKKMKELNFH
jgi:hypothetical protein